MDAVIRPLRPADRPAASRLLDSVVGEGFWRFDDAGAAPSLVAVTEEGVAGVLLSRVISADDPDAQLALASSPAQAVAGGDLTLHVRELAISPSARRSGLASHLLTSAEAEARARGARTAFAFGWLPAGRPDPDSVPFFEAAGYAAGADIAGFFAPSSIESGAHCPYCGAPPCRCAVRPFVKPLTAPAT